MPADRTRLTIALDARTVHRPVRRGIGRSLVEMYRHVLKLRPDWRVIGYHRGEADSPLDEEPNYTARTIDMPGDRFDAWQQWRLPLAAWSDGADVLHCPANTTPRRLPLPAVLTVHDLMPLEGDPATARRFERSVTDAVRRGRPIITPSQFTAEGLIARFGADPQQITVNPWAPDPRMQVAYGFAATDDVCRRYGIPYGPFILHLGAPDPRKNTQRVLEAYVGLPAAARRRWALVIVGMDDAGQRDAIVHRASELGLGDRVIVHGFVDEDDLPALFAAAEVLAYPSLSEGFGLPVLDAFAARTAVLTSDVTSLPEVAGDAAHYVDPTCVASIRRGLLRMTREPSLRRDLVQAGVRRLRQFTWQRTAERLVAAIERSVEARGRATSCAA